MTATSDYLIRKGWRPSPTTHASGDAWEHPNLAVPRWFCEAQGVFDPDQCRFPRDGAVFIALAIERAEEQRIRDSLNIIHAACATAARYATKWAQLAGGRP